MLVYICLVNEWSFFVCFTGCKKGQERSWFSLQIACSNFFPLISFGWVLNNLMCHLFLTAEYDLDDVREIGPHRYQLVTYLRHHNVHILETLGTSAIFYSKSLCYVLYIIVAVLAARISLNGLIYMALADIKRQSPFQLHGASAPLSVSRVEIVG